MHKKLPLCERRCQRETKGEKGRREKRLRGIRECSLRIKKVLIMKNNHAPHKKSSSSPFFTSKRRHRGRHDDEIFSS